MESWCLVKEYYDYSTYENDVTVLHYKNKEDGVEQFREYLKMYIDTYELYPDEYSYDIEEDSYCFSYSDADIEINISLEQIIL